MVTAPIYYTCQNSLSSNESACWKYTPRFHLKVENKVLSGKKFTLSPSVNQCKEEVGKHSSYLLQTQICIWPLLRIIQHDPFVMMNVLTPNTKMMGTGGEREKKEEDMYIWKIGHFLPVHTKPPLIPGEISRQGKLECLFGASSWMNVLWEGVSSCPDPVEISQPYRGAGYSFRGTAQTQRSEISKMWYSLSPSAPGGEQLSGDRWWSGFLRRWADWFQLLSKG